MIPERRSTYVRMRDGVHLAVDALVPPGVTRASAIVHQTRYFRSVRWRFPFDRLGIDRLLSEIHDVRDAMLEAGYVWVDVDVRGSGASEGGRASPWAPEEAADSRQIVDWIVAQPWSDGTVGATGNSYVGTTSEVLAIQRHPAVRAIVPRFCLFDVYTDIAFPGGVPAQWFTTSWGFFNEALDRNDYATAVGKMARVNAAAAVDAGSSRARLFDTPVAQRLVEVFVRTGSSGVRAVEGDRGRLRAAVRGHARNFNVADGAARTVFRDDVGANPERPEDGLDTFSPHAFVGELRRANTHVYNYAGWYDGAYAHGAIKRFLNLDAGKTQLILGPWDHTGRQHVSPFTRGHANRFDHRAEIRGYFDEHLRGVPGAERSAVRYFTFGEERWKECDAWPPPSTERQVWHAGAGSTLTRTPDERDGSHCYAVDSRVGTGKRSRWRTQLGLAVPIGYGDRAEIDRRLLCYTSAPLDAPITITGHAVVKIAVTSDLTDGTFFAYLEHVHPSGRVTYVTEGLFRALHRTLSTKAPPYRDCVPFHSFERADGAPLEPGVRAEIVFALLPISHQVPGGHRLRLALAGADADHFGTVTDRPPTWRVHHGGSAGTRIEIPVESRA